MIREVTIQDNQNIHDLAMQYYGTLEGVFKLVRMNPKVFINSTSEAIKGVKIMIDDSEPNRQLGSKDIIVSTGAKKQPDFNEDFNEDFSA